MARRHGRRAVDPDAPVVDLDRVLADDLEIDRISRQPWADVAGPCRIGRTGARRDLVRHHHAPTDEPLFDLLDDWRHELAGRPLPDPPSTPVAAASTIPGAVSVPRSTPARHHRRSWRPVLAVAAAIGAVLVGSTTVGAADAGPNSPLWPIAQVIWPTRAQSIESAREVEVALAEAQQALAAGRGDAARQAIQRAQEQLVYVDADSRQDIRIRVSSLAESAGTDPDSITAQAILPAADPAIAAAAADEPAAPSDDVVAALVDVAGAPSVLDPTAPFVAAGSSAGLQMAGLAPGSTTAPGTPSTAGPTPSPVTAATPLPGAPATVPDPAVVVEPSVPADPPTTESPASSAVAQSAPSPTQTLENPGVPTVPAPWPASDDGGSPSSAADVPVTDAPTAG